MSNGFPCPNPTCKHQFPSALVAGAASLACPLCGTVFQFRSSSAPARPRAEPLPSGPFAPTAAPISVPAPPVRWSSQRLAPGQLPPPAAPALPEAHPAAGGLPRAHPAAIPPAATYQHVAPTAVPATVPDRAQFEDLDQPGDVPSTYQRPAGTLALYVKTLIFAGVVVGITCGVVYVYQNDLLAPWLAGRPGSTSVAVRPFHSEPLNYRFVAPSSAWLPDDQTQAAARTNIALRRADPTAWAAVIAKDYKTNTPPEQELIQLCLGRLNGYVTDIKFEEKEGEVHLAGHKALCLLFEGNVENVGTIYGEAYLMANGAIGYAVVTWAPQPVFAQAAREFNDVRKGFTLLNKN